MGAPLTHRVRGSVCARRRAKELEQADGAHQEGGQLELLHELYQAGDGLIQGHQLLGGKEPYHSHNVDAPTRGIERAVGRFYMIGYSLGSLLICLRLC